MIRAEKQRGSLMAINAILVLSRDLASHGRSTDLEWILDVAEYLPMLILDAEDQTGAFRDQLIDLSVKYPAFAIAVQRFDAGTV